MQNVLQFNGCYGCSWCLHPGEFIEGAVLSLLCVRCKVVGCLNSALKTMFYSPGSVKYPVTVTAGDRDAAMRLSDMKMAAALQRTVKGVKAPSPLINVPGFDDVGSFRPRFMHTVLLSVVCQMTDIWFSNVGKAQYIGSAGTLSEIDDRLLSQRPPFYYNRTPRSLKLRRYWKASELEAWLLYYSLPCLKGILPAEFLQHFALLVSSVYILLEPWDSRGCRGQQPKKKKQITQFGVMTQCDYGAGQMTSNVHTLLQFPKSVVLHEPLWAVSCFEFENYMGHLVNLVSSSNGIPFQILSRILLLNNFHRLQSMASHEAKELLCVCQHLDLMVVSGHNSGSAADWCIY
ncbi:uncharacterized protein LOC125945017 [Dermacentor silvarum]|uniref:uncharacterized protein LOC125945017 n=1 Tax=Dermacentor silvarum TaxID=543639 RepID=UPI0021014555|nr:uncharacterized protein LOC125945017 [Dermacentor silvarum]